MSQASKFVPRYTVDDYQQWQGDWELWDGIAVAMTPSPFGPHQNVLFALAAELRQAIRSAGCEATALGELDWIVSPNTVVRPDVIVVCGDAPAEHLREPPGLVAEVLSSSTRQTDLTFKRDLYQAEGVPLYLIVDPHPPTLEINRRQSDGRYVAEQAKGKFSLQVCGDCVLSLDSDAIFAS